MPIYSPQIIQLPRVNDIRGNLSFFESENQLPFDSMSHILKMSIKERFKFYKSFSRDEYAIMKSWPSRYWQMKLIQYPEVSQVLLLFLSPAYRIVRSVKHLVKRKS